MGSVSLIKFFKDMRQSLFVDSASVVFHRDQYAVFYRSQIYVDGRIFLSKATIRRASG